jgi:hypothetical protein
MDQQPVNPSEIKLDSDGSFVVGESKLINYLFGSLFLVMFLVVLASTDIETYWMVDLSLLFFPALFFTTGLKNRKKMSINAMGIYHNKTLITNWTNFRHAYIRQLLNTTARSQGLVDHYIITVVYFDQSRGVNYLYPIRLSESQDKSEYEIIDAIIYFSGKQLSYDIYD